MRPYGTPLRFRAGERVIDRVTGIPCQIIEPLSAWHPRTGSRLYLTRSPAGRERRLQERNLARPTINKGVH